MSDIVEAVEAANRLAALSPVSVYAKGAFSCSVCAPGDWPAEQVQAEVNRIYLCGTEKGWTVSDDRAFATGQPMPCVCESDATRKHWLLDA